MPQWRPGSFGWTRLRFEHDVANAGGGIPKGGIFGTPSTPAELRATRVAVGARSAPVALPARRRPCRCRLRGIADRSRPRHHPGRRPTRRPSCSPAGNPRGPRRPAPGRSSRAARLRGLVPGGPRRRPARNRRACRLDRPFRGSYRAQDRFRRPACFGSRRRGDVACERLPRRAHPKRATSLTALASRRRAAPALAESGPWITKAADPPK